ATSRASWPPSAPWPTRVRASWTCRRRPTPARDRPASGQDLEDRDRTRVVARRRSVQVAREERVLAGSQDQLEDVAAGARPASILGPLFRRTAAVVEPADGGPLGVATGEAGEIVLGQGTGPLLGGRLPLDEPDARIRRLEHHVNVAGLHGRGVEMYRGPGHADGDQLCARRDGLLASSARGDQEHRQDQPEI